MSGQFVLSETAPATAALVRYTFGLDTPDRSLLESSLTEDAILGLSNFSTLGLTYPPIEGRSAVVNASMNAVGNILDTSHTLSNFCVAATGDDETTAEIQCYAEAQHFRKGDGLANRPKDCFLVKSRYDAIVIQVEGMWKIKQLQITPMWCQGEASILGG
jgi:hypothetical protein